MLRLVCPDGAAPVPKDILPRLSVFRAHPNLVDGRSYELRCKARLETVSLFLGRVYDARAQVTVTDSNFTELQNLSDELGFSGLDADLRMFETAKSRLTTNQKIGTLEERIDECDLQIEGIEGTLETVMNHIKRLDLLEEKCSNLESLVREQDKRECEFRKQLVTHHKRFHQKLRELVREKKTAESDTQSLVQRIQSLEIRVDEVVEGQKKISMEPSPTAPEERLVPLEHFQKLASDVKQLKESESRHEKEIRDLDHIPKCFACGASNELNGVIAYLTQKYGGNVHDNGIVAVTACKPRGHPKKAVDLDSEDAYISKNQENSWLCCDFLDNRVIPTSYSMKSNNEQRPKSWAFEVSSDGSSWTEIDRREDNYDLNDPMAIHNFTTSHVTGKDGFQFIRIRQTGPNHAGDHTFVITLLEIFGTFFWADGRESEFAYDGSNTLDGIIAHLTRECGGNVHEQGILKVTCNSLFHPKFVANLSTRARFLSYPVRDSWICYDFKCRQIIPASYSVMSRFWPGEDPCNHPKSWVLEGSNDGTSWTELDRREDNHDLNSSCAIQNFKISRMPSGCVRFIRIRQTGPNHKGGYTLSFAALEIFGLLLGD